MIIIKQIMVENAALKETISVIPAAPIHVQGLWRFARPSGFAGKARSTTDHLVHLVEIGSYRLGLGGRSWSVTAPALIWYHDQEAVTWTGDAHPVCFCSCAFASPGLAPPPAGERVRQAPEAVATAFAQLMTAAQGTGLQGALGFQIAACHWLDKVLAAYCLATGADTWDRVERRALASGVRPTIADLAAWAGTSISSLERLCRDRHGCSPGVRLRSLRLLQAEALAAQGGLRRPDVARLTGYSDRRSLRRALLREHP